MLLLFGAATWCLPSEDRGDYAQRMRKVRTEEGGGDGAEIKNMFHNRLGKGSTKEEKGRHGERKG